MGYLEAILSISNIYLATFIFCFVSGLIPLLNTEIYLMSISTLASPAVTWPVTFIATSGQLIAKTLIYLTGRGIIHLPLKQYETKMAEIKEKFNKWENAPYLFVFISGLIGIPPFYAVTFFAGMIKLDFIKFFIAGFLGRFMRFAVAVQLPQIFIKIFK